MEKLGQYRKLFSAVLIPIIVFALEASGVELPPDWSKGIMAVLTPILVWAVPNNA